MTDELKSFDIDDEPQGEAPAPEGEDAERAERIDEIKRLAASGELDAPAEADEIVAALVDTLRERDAVFAKLQHAVADHQNFARRASNNEREARVQAQTGVLQSVIPILDHFELALGQNPETTSAASVIDGVRMIRSELLRSLSQFGVAIVAPAPGDAFDPVQHEAMLYEPAEGVEQGAVARCLGQGYTLSGRVVRPAKVALAQPTQNPASEPEDA